MIDLNFNFSKELEKWRIKTCLAKLDWYQAQGYKINLPEAGQAEEYSEADFQEYADFIQAAWPKYSDKLSQALAGLRGAEIQSAYKVNLTKYGVGGSYSYPNEVIINVAQKERERAVLTLIHEITHLSIHQLINKYQIEHWQKERLVDLITMRIFPELFSLQRDPGNAGLIGRHFDQYYPDIEKIISTVSEKTRADK